MSAFFVRSTLIHLRRENAATTEDLVALMDRFLDDRLSYDLEWDDFISWENDNPHVEAIRDRLGRLEPMLFSREAAQRELYAQAVVSERERLAALLNLPARDEGQRPAGGETCATPDPTCCAGHLLPQGEKDESEAPRT